MTQSGKLTSFIKTVGGIASAAQIKEAGFHPGTIAHALKTGAIDKLTRGVYCTVDVFDDEFATISYRWKKCVFSHDSALFLAGLSDRVPSRLDVSAPYGYNPIGLRKEHSDLRIHREKLEIYEIGIEPATTPTGAIVKSYCAERAVADLIAQRVTEGADPQIIHDGIVGYFKRKNKDLHKLAKICKVLGVENELRMYLEVLAS